MTTIGWKWRAAALGLVVGWGACLEGTARGQAAVAFTPQVGAILNGAAMQVTPVVSADRRYVRVSVNAYFNTVNGFTTYTAPLGAVSGGGVGSIGGGGVGGGLGGAGGGGLGGAGGGVAGGGGFAGMDGPIAGMGMAGPMPPTAGFARTGTYLAGEYPPTAGAGLGRGGPADPFGQAGVIPMGPGAMNEGRADLPQAGQDHEADPFGLANAPAGPFVRAPRRDAAGRRHSARKPSRRSSTASRRHR